MVLEIIISKFSCILKIMSRNTFPNPQPYSASELKDQDNEEKLKKLNYLSNMQNNQ